MWYLNWLEIKQRPNHLAKKLVDATATIQTTLPHRNFGHALALFVPNVWRVSWGTNQTAPPISVNIEIWYKSVLIVPGLCQAAYIIFDIIFYMRTLK